MKLAGNNWNVDANIASSREYFPVAGNDTGKEFNDVSGNDPYATTTLPSYDYSPSLNEVLDVGNLDKGSSSSLVRKVLISGATLLVTAGSLLSTISSSKPTLSEKNIEYVNGSITYSLKITYTKVGTLYVKVANEEKSEQKQYTLPWDDSVTSSGSSKIKTITDSFDISSWTNQATLTISAQNGYGVNQLDKESFILK
jgi:hypothetical protein